MPRFVDFHTYYDGLVQVNADAVLYVKTGLKGETQLVFGAFHGGMHMLTVAGPRAEAIERLEGGERAPADVSPKPSRRYKSPP
ncbi:MAG TPA: hypothetical protein VMU59_04235 [Caulobacteraceae bacterium]|nr:hypothetical protein [Caulobacteraceae bacterium]